MRSHPCALLAQDVCWASFQQQTTVTCDHTQPCHLMTQSSGCDQQQSVWCYAGAADRLDRNRRWQDAAPAEPRRGQRSSQRGSCPAAAQHGAWGGGDGPGVARWQPERAPGSHAGVPQASHCSRPEGPGVPRLQVRPLMLYTERNIQKTILNFQFSWNEVNFA